MCGFVGVVSGEAPGGARQRCLDEALSALRHRGPDDQASYQAPGLVLGHVRLSIIDLSPAARQPMRDRAGRYVLVFNGEIYNYRELASQHLSGDVEVNRHSDTSVLLGMYRQFGHRCLARLDGMFAFAVIDLHERTVFLARDRFGEKPLYLFRAEGLIAFASELKALRTLLPERQWEIDPDSLAIYHQVGSIPAPRTIYRGASAVKPGCWVKVAPSGQFEEGSYWSLADVAARHSAAPVRSYAEAVAGCRERLLQAVRSRMVSDVPVGIFLSGGLDSGSILSLLAAQGFDGLDALCIDFPEHAYSEYALASASAAAYGARLNRSVVTPDSFIRHLDAFFAGADQPTTDGFNTFFVAMHGRELGIKVWLSGVGGDELFGGYPSFRRLGRMSGLARLLQAALPGMSARAWAKGFPFRLKVSRALHMCHAGAPALRAYQALRCPLPWHNVSAALAPAAGMPEAQARLALDRLYPETGFCRDAFQRASAMESAVYMGSQLLRDIDNFSMCHSIETRAPFLDADLFEYVFSLPSRFKSRGGRSKPLLVDSLPNPLPRQVLAQPKRGFTFPVEVWMKAHMTASFREHVLDGRNGELWDLDFLGRMWRRYLEGGLHWSTLWGFYAFARWRKAHDERD